MNRLVNILVVLCLYVLEISAQTFPNYIAHGGGAMGRRTYTNSREAILQSIERGYSFIELDLDTTSEGVLVAMHSWRSFHKSTGHSEYGDSIFPLDSFKSALIYQEYTPVTIDEVVEILQQNPSIFLVTDKISDADVLDRSLSGIRERVYVEAFSIKDFIQLRERGYHPMYSHGIASISSSVIENLMMGKTRIDFLVNTTSNSFKEISRIRCLMSMKIAMYTSNSMDFIESHLGTDVDLIYTDFYCPLTGEMLDP